MKMRLRDSPGLWDSSEWLLISSRLPRLWDSWDSYLLYLKFCQELWYYSARGRPHGKNLKFEGEQLWSAAVLHWDHCTEAALWKENGRIETWFNFKPHCPPSALNDKVWIWENLADLRKSSFSAILRRGWCMHLEKVQQTCTTAGNSQYFSWENKQQPLCKYFSHHLGWGLLLYCVENTRLGFWPL